MSLRGGRYEIIRTIASGGMAVVHLGRALGVGGFERLVAVKVMHPHVASEPECVDMFLDEARLAARIRHPNVVGTIDVSEDELGVFLVMEYVEGPSFQAVLRELKKKKAERPLDVMLRIFIDALHGLHAAHELNDADGSPLNLVHRDVSPQNILIGVDGIARITDFGVARAETRLSTTQSGQIKGKFAFMAPEQVRMLPVDRRADVYAAGVLLWEVLTGKKLVEADNELAIITQILTQKWQLPHEVNEAAPRPLSDVCMRAMMASPDARYPTTAAFAEALEVAAKEAGIAVATARQVSTFIRELNAHEAAGDMPGPVSNRPLRNTIPPSNASRPPPPVASRPPPSLSSPPRPEAASGAPVEPTPEPAFSVTQQGAVLTSSAAPKERRRGARMVTLAIAAPVLLVGAWLLVRSTTEEASGAQDARLAAPAMTSSPAESPVVAEPKAAEPKKEEPTPA
ncbi:MAG TPA: serine/threonine-protein kinase, partial [Polyangiaceae bacterium]|nr:serine/threonine-protein kinase [Polyangiaceae bacterium]